MLLCRSMGDKKIDDVDMDGSDSDDMEEDDGAEAANLARLMELEAVLKDSPFHYQSHVDKIEVLKQLGELEQLRSSRESFSRLFPLSPDLWLSWLRDEQGVSSSTEEEKARLFELFERAVKDYVSVDVWLEFCQFSLCGLGSPEGVSKARDVFERAVAQVGLHVARGALIWEAYKEFAEHQRKTKE